MGKKKKGEGESRKETNTETESQKPAQGWRPILRGTIHSLSSGWLQNLLIGLVLLLIGPAVGMIVKSPKVVILCAAGGITLVVWIVALIMIRQIAPGQRSTAPSGPFFVEIEASVVHERKGFTASRVFIGYRSSYGDTLSPVDVSMFIKLVNLQQVPSMIERLRVEMKLDDSEWIKLVNIPLRGSTVFWAGPEGFKKVRKIDPTNSLDYLLADRPVQPHETIRGWVYLDMPTDYFAGEGTRIQYRVTARDSAGATLVYVTPTSVSTARVAPPGTSDYIQTIPWHILPGYADISSFHRKYYSEPFD